MWIDTHAHLYDFSTDELKIIIDEAKNCSVGLIISTATNLTNSEIVVSQCYNNAPLYGAIGISPFDVATAPADWQEILSKIIRHDKIIAVGEIGLDQTNPSYPPLKEQLPFFNNQLQIADESDLPAIIHSRGVEEKAVDICKHLGIRKVVFHCFTGDYDSAKKIIDQGYYISFSGIITFKNASIRSLVQKLPIDQILIETDTPYLTPVPFRGKPNKPSFVHLVGEEIATLLKIEPEQFQVNIEKNFKKCFNIV